MFPASGTESDVDMGTVQGAKTKKEKPTEMLPTCGIVGENDQGSPTHHPNRCCDDITTGKFILCVIPSQDTHTHTCVHMCKQEYVTEAETGSLSA